MQKVKINEIQKFAVGHAQDFTAATGCTVIICEDGAVCGVDVRGGSPGTRDTDALNPVNNRKSVHAVLLSGGSSFGLDAAGGVMKYLEEHKIGRDVGVTVVPNVCAAILFDLKCGDYKIRPDEKMGYESCVNAFSKQPFSSGNFGAGTGATIGKIRGGAYAMKGGIGSCAFRHKNLFVGAIMAVNCVGDIFDSQTGKIIAGARADDGKTFIGSENVILEQYNRKIDIFSGNTIIGCVITNARLDKTQATKLASLGQNGLARAVRPAHSIYDGDTVFAMCTGEVSATLDAVGILAAAAVEGAIIDAVKNADSLEGFTALKDILI